VTRALLQRRVLLPVLIGYAAIIVIASWRAEIRPPFLDLPVAVARNLIGLLGVPPGVAVFTTDDVVLRDEVFEAFCLEVRTVEGDRPARRIYPPPGRVCPAPPPRLWIRGEEIALERMARALQSSAAWRRAGTLAPSQIRFPKLFSESLADHFRSRARADGLAPDRYALLWTSWKRSLVSGESSERIVAIIRWQADPGGNLFISWSPDEQKLQEHWPELEKP